MTVKNPAKFDDLLILYSKRAPDEIEAEQCGKDGVILVARIYRRSDPPDAKHRFTSTVLLPKDVLTDLGSISKAIDLAEEQIKLDLAEINGEHPFADVEPDDAILGMREAMGVN